LQEEAHLVTALLADLLLVPILLDFFHQIRTNLPNLIQTLRRVFGSLSSGRGGSGCAGCADLGLWVVYKNEKRVDVRFKFIRHTFTKVIMCFELFEYLPIFFVN
jgi:hypothetical protein